MKKKILIIVTNFLIILIIVVLYALYRFNYIPHKKYTNEDFNIKTYISKTDKDNDGIDDQTDILNNVRNYIKTNPKYKSKYYDGGYPTDEYRVCTDIIWYALKNAGYDFKTLIEWQLKEKHPKSWFRAYFNMGLINYIHDNQRLLPCEAGLVNFFVDPYGEIYPCNGLEDKFWKESMGNIRQSGSFYEIWHSEQAEKIRQKVRNCPKHCWMVGTVSPVMKKYISQPLKWVVRNKWNILTGKPIQIELNDKK